MFIAIASVLSVFNIAPLLDENGEPLRIVPKQTTSALS